LQVYPEARDVHENSNGVDVESIHTQREESRQNHVMSTEGSVQTFLEDHAARPQEARSRLAWFLWKLGARSTKLSSLHKYRKLRAHRCLALDHGFELWREYVRRGSVLAERLGDRALTLRYEDLLTDPMGAGRALGEHSKVDPDPGALSAAAALVRSEGAYKFRRNPDLSSFYDRVRTDPLMTAFGYDDL
ncbi:MAG: hypothetical protein P8Y93_11840, partial [Acidobacteriota bacterium]